MSFRDIPLPKRVSIMGINYTVELVEDLRDDSGRGMDGHISYNFHTIQVDRTLEGQAQWETLVHEIIHGILTQNGRGDLLDEAQLDALAYGIVGTLQTTNWEVECGPTNNTEQGDQ